MNDWTRDFAARTPDTLWSATFYPEPEAAAYVPALIADGVEVFKAHMQVGDFVVQSCPVSLRSLKGWEESLLSSHMLAR